MHTWLSCVVWCRQPSLIYTYICNRYIYLYRLYTYVIDMYIYNRYIYIYILHIYKICSAQGQSDTEPPLKKVFEFLNKVLCPLFCSFFIFMPTLLSPFFVPGAIQHRPPQQTLHGRLWYSEPSFFFLCSRGNPTHNPHYKHYMDTCDVIESLLYPQVRKTDK